MVFPFKFPDLVSVVSAAPDDASGSGDLGVSSSTTRPTGRFAFGSSEFPPEFGAPTDGSAAAPDLKGRPGCLAELLLSTPPRPPIDAGPTRRLSSVHRHPEDPLVSRPIVLPPPPDSVSSSVSTEI